MSAIFSWNLSNDGFLSIDYLDEVLIRGREKKEELEL